MVLGAPIVILLLAVLGIAIGVFLIVFLIVPIFKGVGWLVRHVFRFVTGMILDLLRIIGAVVTSVVLVPIILANVVIGRWSASVHFGRSLQSEVSSGALSLYRVVIGHPARFLLLSALTEGLEKRLPAAVAAAPQVDRPSGRNHQFSGYTIVGSLQAGGSGGKLFVANPDAAKRAAFERAGHVDVRQVVIKTFSLDDGSELPQIVRESRSLDAAKKLGLVLDHELSSNRFHYVMRYVPGQPLGLVTPQLHAASGGHGLDPRHLRAALGYIADLLETLENYHRGGLWHKDVKPDNIIVDGERAHLVDFGLVTPLRSSMTLTTHGTEYFRDPELVRLALKGVKVSEVDGARFDVYATGAVLYAMIENSFPAHGVLSQVTRTCPESLKWVIRRAMADYDKRYPSAAAMLVDLRHVLQAADPFAVKPFELPSMNGQVPASPRPFDEAGFRPAYVSMPPIDPSAWHDRPAQPAGAPSPRAASSIPPADTNPPGHGSGRSKSRNPLISVKNWWTGEFSVEGNPPARSATPTPWNQGTVPPSVAVPGSPFSPATPVAAVAAPRRSAAEQLRSARARAADARRRAASRLASRRAPSFSTEPNAGVFMALFFFLGVCVLIVGAIVAFSLNASRKAVFTSARVDADGGWATMTYPVTPSPRVAASTPFAPPVPAAPIAAIAEAPVEFPAPALAEGEDPRWVASNNGSIFVWVDMQRPLSPAYEAAIQDLRDRLRSRGFLVMGDTDAPDKSEHEQAVLVDQTAALVSQASGLPWESPTARDAMSMWAKDQPGVDLVLRVNASPKGRVSRAAEGTLSLSLVTRHSQDPTEGERLGRLLNSAQRSLWRGSDR